LPIAEVAFVDELAAKDEIFNASILEVPQNPGIQAEVFVIKMGGAEQWQRTSGTCRIKNYRRNCSQVYAKSMYAS
jgi:hypothetical protein